MTALITGGMVASVLDAMGIAKVRVAAIIFIVAGLSAAAPPVSLWAMMTAAGVNMPYVGFFLPLLIPCVLGGLFTMFFLGWKGRRAEFQEVLAALPVPPERMNWVRVLFPFGVFLGRGLFAGWRIVGVTLATQALQAGLLIYAFGTLAVPLAAEFNVGRAKVMLASTFLGLATNLLSPFAGRFVDRVPIRRLMLVAIACLFAGLCLVASARSLMQVWLAFALVLPVAQLLLGQMTSAALVSRWFVRLRGRALGVSALGTTIGGFIFPVLLATLSARYGWRTAVVLIAAGAVVAVAPLIAALVVDRPQDRGMQPEIKDRLRALYESTGNNWSVVE